MTELVHDATGERTYEYGSSKAVLFPHTGGAYVWNGFTGVNINPTTENDSEKWYFDGVIYYEKIEADEFSAEIQCVNTPKAFLQCEGVYESTDYPGMYTHQNPRIKFNLAWVTQIGNDETENLGYRLHIVYNAQAQPSGRSYQTKTDVSTPESRSITIKTTPACGIWSYYTFDSREADVDALLNTILGGTLPPCNALSVGPPPPPTEEESCINLVDDFNSYNPGLPIDETDEDVENDTEVTVFGIVNNGLDITEIPILGVDMEDNGSAATPTIVGTGDVLADDDDTTYVTSGEGDLGYTFPIPPLTGGYAVGSKIELHIRMSIDGLVNPDDPDNVDAEAQVHISTDVEGLEAVGGFSDGAQEGMAFKLTDVSGTPTDYVVPLRMDAWVNSTEADVVAALEAGAFMNFRGASNFNSDPAELPVEVRVYEAKIVILNLTDGDFYLRAYPDTDQGWIKKMIWNAGHTDYLEQAFTSFIDFKVKSVALKSTAIGDTKKVMAFDGDIPGSLQVEIDAGHLPVVAWRDEGTTTPADVTFSIEYETWYRARVYWTWGAANVKVWERDAGSVTYLLDRNLTPSIDPQAFIENDAGYVGDSEVTAEVVLDNSRFLANCFEEAPLESFTLDLPAWDATGPGGGGAFDEMGTPDTSTYVTVTHDERYAPEYFGETDTGTAPSNVNIYMPATPPGYVLTKAHYVVIARRSSNDGSAFSPYAGYFPAPTTVPFLYCESSGVTNSSGNSSAPSEFVFNDIPVGSFGEVECSADEVLSRLTGIPGTQIPANRIWCDDFRPGLGVGTAHIDIAYFAIRLYYDPA